MIKYKVIRTDGVTEFTTLELAQQYFNSIDNGIEINEVNEDDSPVYEVIDEEIPTWRLKVILAMMGILDTVNNILDGLSEPQKTVAKLAWEYGTVTRRLSPFVLGVQQALSLTDEEVDNIFQQAKNIDV